MTGLNKMFITRADETIKKLPLFLLALVFSTVVGCSGGSGQDPEPGVNTGVDNTDNSIQYNGPAPTTDDVQNFKVNVWDNLAGPDRCGACHVEGNQAPMFVRADDINLAYQSANAIVDLSAPALSRMVTKVAEGHNCWRPEASVCADTITNYIQAWAGDSGAEPQEIVLTAPVVKEVGNSRSFPADSGEFATLIQQPYLVPFCGSCHAEDTALQQQPYIGSADPDVSYDAAKARINLDDPANSRLVTRLGTEFHNCWSNNCAADADAMEAAIQAFADGIPLTEIDPSLVVSHALSIPDGVVAASGGRIQSAAIALYEFKTGSGTTAYDTSGVDPAADLNITGNVQWVGSWGLRINDGGIAQAPTGTSRKLFDLIRATGEYSVEAWVIPDNVAQDGPARIVTYSGSTEARNFTLGQTLYNYNFMSRSSNSDEDGMPMLSTADADEVLQATLQHVVVTFDPIAGRRIYVNGELVQEDTEPGGNLNEWNDTFALAVGAEVGIAEQWQGTVRLLAIHNRVLEPEQVVTNFEAGVGQKFFLLFGVSHLIDMPDAYVVMGVEQYDNYSYLFNSPFFISLNETAVPAGDIRIQGIRIGINGKEAVVGQAFGKVDVTINSSNYDAGGVNLSPLGTVIELEKGPDADEFFLTFDHIGGVDYDRPVTTLPEPAAPADLGEQSDIGLRNFAEINATLAAVTTVSVTDVADIFNTVQQQLPTSEAIDGFLAAHQAGVMQMSVAYCTELATNTSLRSAYFPDFNFGGALNASTHDAVITPLMNHLLANDIDIGGGTMTPIATQPDPAAFRTRLEELSDEMSGTDTQTAVIAVCASAVGSAVMLLQ